MTMATIERLEDGFLDQPADLLADIQPSEGVLFVCNVGNADALVMLLPIDHLGVRRALVMDAGRVGKVPSLLEALKGQIGFPPDGDPTAVGSVPIVISSHPHADHIRGLPEVLSRFSDRLVEYWDSGYYHPSDKFHQLMTEVEDNPNLIYAQPTSGYRRFLSTAKLTVLAPGISLRNRYDSYGVRINDASLSLMVEFPAVRVVQREGVREYMRSTGQRKFLLGADAQTMSWSQILVDFPQLLPSSSAAAKAIGAAKKPIDMVEADVLKVSHHGSKRGVNLELLERVNAEYLVVSSGEDTGRHHFPHGLGMDYLREARKPIEAEPSGQRDRNPDHELGLFFTADRLDTNGEPPLGTIAIVGGPQRLEMWRLQDEPDDEITLNHLHNARRWTAPIEAKRPKWV